MVLRDVAVADEGVCGLRRGHREGTWGCRGWLVVGVVVVQGGFTIGSIVVNLVVVSKQIKHIC